MIISKLEIERYIEAYQEYKKDSEQTDKWFANQTYLENNGLYDILKIIEDVVDIKKIDCLIDVLKALGVEVV